MGLELPAPTFSFSAKLRKETVSSAPCFHSRDAGQPVSGNPALSWVPGSLETLARVNLWQKLPLCSKLVFSSVALPSDQPLQGFGAAHSV